MAIQLKSPLTKKLSSEGPSSKLEHTQQSIVSSDSVINDLYSKFMTISKDITIDHDLSAFNLVEFQRDKAGHDQQFKLKKLENKAQLRRADLELENRRKKSPKRNHSTIAASNQDGYLSVYKKFINNQSRKLFDAKSDTDSQDEGRKRDEESLSGINFYGQLKRHPRFLQYTLEKRSEKENREREENKLRLEKLESMRKEIKHISETDTGLLTSRARLEGSETNPEEIADNIFRKIYTKRNKELKMQEARKQQRIAKIIDKQDSILDSLEEKSLSKDNYKKLKVRLGLIVHELYRDEKKHQAKIFLPQIKPSNTSSRVSKFPL